MFLYDADLTGSAPTRAGELGAGGQLGRPGSDYGVRSVLKKEGQPPLDESTVTALQETASREGKLPTSAYLGWTTRRRGER